jgi:hypothetical protein
MNPNGVGQEEIQAVINEWAEQNNINEFISAGDVSENVLRRLRGLEDDGLVWHCLIDAQEKSIVVPGIQGLPTISFPMQPEREDIKNWLALFSGQLND